MILRTVGSCQRQDVVIVNLLLTVGQGEELLIELIQFLLVVDTHAQHFQTILQRSASASGR